MNQPEELTDAKIEQLIGDPACPAGYLIGSGGSAVVRVDDLVRFIAQKLELPDTDTASVERCLNDFVQRHGGKRHSAYDADHLIRKLLSKIRGNPTRFRYEVYEVPGDLIASSGWSERPIALPPRD